MNNLWMGFEKTVRKNYVWFGRISLFLVYFWFGILKLIGFSPAAPLVYELERATLPFIPFELFYMSFSLFEMLIGILFLIPRLTRIAFVLFILHMGMTLMPLVLLPDVSWSLPLVPTLKGQYMIKNIVLIALACSILVNTSKKK